MLRRCFLFILMTTSIQLKQELFKAIWAISEDLRNSLDGWYFKKYVIKMLFYRFISENITNYVNKIQHEAGDSEFDYAKFSDEEAESTREQLVKEKGFFILPSQLLCNVRARAISRLPCTCFRGSPPRVLLLSLTTRLLLRMSTIYRSVVIQSRGYSSANRH